MRQEAENKIILNIAMLQVGQSTPITQHAYVKRVFGNVFVLTQRNSEIARWGSFEAMKIDALALLRTGKLPPITG